MDLLTGSLVVGSTLLLYEVVSGITEQLDPTLRKWKKLLGNTGLKDYKIKSKKDTNTGYELMIELPIGGSVKALEDIKEQIEKTYECKALIENIPFSDLVKAEIIVKEIDQMEFKPIILPNTKLLLGYDFKGEPIIVDMLSTPHALISGLSGTGKTGLIRTLICNLQDCDKVLINGFKDDFKGINIRHINTLEEIKNYIQGLLEGIEEGINRDKPLYVILEELGKIKDKDLIGAITKLLQYGRHNKIYILGITQIATKEELKFKSFFNTRISFKQLDTSSYQVALGVAVDKDLLKRQFYVLGERLQRGTTYNLDY